jgi:hypothetical protein
MTGTDSEKKLKKGDCCSPIMRIEILYLRAGLLQYASDLLKTV